MRRLMSAIRIHLLKARQAAADQHVADLEKMLSDLVTARDTVDAEIIETTKRLLVAKDVRNAFSSTPSQQGRQTNGKLCGHNPL